MNTRRPLIHPQIRIRWLIARRVIQRKDLAMECGNGVGVSPRLKREKTRYMVVMRSLLARVMWFETPSSN